MKQEHQQSTGCSDPKFESHLLDDENLRRWKGLPISWVQDDPHTVNADLETQRNTLVFIDTGAIQSDFLYGSKSMSMEFTAGSIGFFSKGTELKKSQWRWTATRRIYLDVESDLNESNPLATSFQTAVTQFEFRDVELANVLRMMAREVAGGCPNGALFAQSLSLGVSERIAQHCARVRSRTSERGKLTPGQLRHLEDLVRSAIGTDLNLATLAEATGYSPPQFVRLFKNSTGGTPYQYILRVRLRRARELVEGSDLPLAAIATMTGFSSQAHMTTVFAKAFEIPPGQLRRASKLRHPPFVETG